MLAWGCVCKRVAVEQPISCGALMCYVVGAACGPDSGLYAPPRALPNVRERGTLPTDGALHVPNSGRTPQSAIAHFPFATHLSSNGWPMCSRESQWTARVKTPRKKRAPNPPRGRGGFQRPTVWRHTCGQTHCCMETWQMCLPKSLKTCMSLSWTWPGAVIGNVDGRRRPRTHSNICITPGVRVTSECCARATPLRHVYTGGRKHYLAGRTESRQYI